MRAAPDTAPRTSEPDPALRAPSVRDPSQQEDAGRFAAEMAAVTAAFGDPTRRRIFLHVRSQPGMTASQVAAEFALHPNVARHHLDRLVAAGYLRTVTGAPGQGAGRPSKRFHAVGGDLTAALLPRRDDLLAALLRASLELLGPEQAERMAAMVGEEYGRSLASRMAPAEGQRSVRAAMHAIAETFTAHGFDAHAEDQDDITAVVADHCPFGDVAVSHPVLCAVDRGMVKGLLAGLCGTTQDDHGTAVVLSSRARGDDTCAALA